jgi:hypothetical protein
MSSAVYLNVEVDRHFRGVHCLASSGLSTSPHPGTLNFGSLSNVSFFGYVSYQPKELRAESCPGARRRPLLR